jgi:uncharacterized paraquat-inducible protein A
MLKYLEVLVPICTDCERFVKKFAIQRRAEAVIPNCNSSTLRRIEWSTQSKAELKSSKRRAVMKPESSAKIMSL